MNDIDALEQQYKHSGKISLLKFCEYIPSMILTNLSTLLLITVDGLVVGNFEGKEALSSISIFYPITLLIGVVSAVVSTGISTVISTRFGGQNKQLLNSAKKMAFWVTIVSALVIAIVQIPIVYGILFSYRMGPELEALTRQYAIGLMIASPLGLISCVGTYELQIMGKMNYLMWLSIAEGGVNLLLDLFFVGGLGLGVAGAGYGTLCANIVRCSLTVILLYKKTSIFQFSGAIFQPSIIKEIISLGLPEASKAGMSALQSYVMMQILIHTFGTGGGVIKGVASFAFALANVLMSGIRSAVRPLAGLFAGSDNKIALKTLMSQAFAVTIAATIALTGLFLLFPSFSYLLHGVHTIPEGGILSIRLYVLSFVFQACNAMMLLYFTNRKDTKFATTLTILGSASLPVFAFALMWFCPPPFIWLSYLFSEVLIYAVSKRRFTWWEKKDKEELSSRKDEMLLSLSISPSQAVEASRSLRQFATSHGVSEKISYRVALCIEEMVAYTTATKKNRSVHEQISIRFMGKNKAICSFLDDGLCVNLDKNENSQKLTADNYEFLRRVATNVRYEYILDMNYAVFTFEDKECA